MRGVGDDLLIDVFWEWFGKREHWIELRRTGGVVERPEGLSADFELVEGVGGRMNLVVSELEKMMDEVD